MKPRIFIGSSKESVKIAEKVKSLLDGEYVCQLWCDNFFDLGQCTYHELLKKSLSFDYAIFIGGKDDYVRRESDRTHKYAARDNVYLEFGLYAGILTYARCFFLIQEGCQIASDLLGVNVVFFDKMQDLSKKILTITEKIQKEQKVARISLLPSTSLAVGYFENFLKPVSQAIQKLDAVCIAGKKYDVKNSAKRLEVAIPAKVSEDLRMWSEYVYENHAVEKVTVDSSIRKIGVNIDYGKLENTGDLNRLVALFICKLVDEIQKDMEEIVDFQYKVGTDTYESLQDRLQRLHKEGMEKFMKEEIFYVPDDYAENLVRQYTGQERKNMIAHLKHTLRILKFYTNNDFAFKDVHNEQLFLQNGKILVEVVQLFEKFRIIGSENLQMLGDLFEQLLSKGFKQNEGQFFTPVPITRFIWNSLPVEKILKTEEGAGLPKIIDYACGAGHFLTEGFEAVSACVKANDSLRELDRSFAENNIFGIEKDYRLARVSKISLFMHGAGEGNIIFGDGLENYPDKNIKPNTFDILVANPPYSVSAFKPHLKLKNNSFSILDTISNNGSEIETLFVERISQLLKPNAVAAVILPSSILNKENESFICARESILKNFKIRAIVLMGNKTFGATGTNTVVLFLEKYNEPPKKADLIEDSIDAVFNGCNLDGWEDKAILEQYLKKIDVSSEVYERFLSEAVDIGDIEDKYFLKYKEAFLALSKTKEKQKQKTFGKLSEKEQKKLLTKQYYQYVKKIEREKMKYFSFVYDQRTLIVAAPDDNKGQEKFLGYKWSNRKGQEGIQIIDEGGMLYDAENRMSDRTIASLIRKMFNGEEVSLDDLEEYYYYLHTKDMISFSEVYFNKAIKTTKTRLLKDDPGLTVYSLSNEKTFDITIGDRVLSEEIVSGGRVPVYSANVYEEFGRIDKENMKDYSRPSVIWGIDGDWMVNIIPAGVPFYPTDHCGVLRIKTEKILPEYMMYALQAEGEYERFSRNNRASAQRIRSLVVQAPETKIQKNIIDELKALDDKINGQNAEIEKYENSIRTKFDQIFHLEEFISDGVFSKYEGYSVEDLCIDGRGRVINQQYIENHKGPYPVYSSQTTNDGIFGSIDTFDFDGEYITWTTDGAKAGTVFYRNGKFNCTNVCGTLKAKNDKVNMRYLAYLLNRIAYKFVSRVGNNKLMNDAMKKIVVPVPKRQLQDEFADFVQSVEKSKFECIGKKEKFEIEKDTFVHKYFR